MSTIHLGLKLGQPQEQAGLVVTEREDKEFTVVAIHHFPAGTAYRQIAEQTAKMLRADALQGKDSRLYLNITDLGQPIQDLVYRRIADTQCSLVPVTCDGGDRLDREARPWVVGKQYLLSQMKMLLEEGWLHLPKTDLARRLVAEVKTFQPAPRENPLEVFQIGAQDALATALGLAVCDNWSGAGMLLMNVDPFDPENNDGPDPDDPYRVFWQVQR